TRHQVQAAPGTIEMKCQEWNGGESEERHVALRPKGKPDPCKQHGYRCAMWSAPCYQYSSKPAEHNQDKETGAEVMKIRRRKLRGIVYRVAVAKELDKVDVQPAAVWCQQRRSK